MFLPLHRFSGAAVALSCLLAPGVASAQALPAIADKTRGMQRMDGFVPLYWDGAGGKLYLEVPRLGQELLYVVSLPVGLGSNDIGLDRGQLGSERVVRFERVGPRVLLVQPNLRYRAESTANPAEQRAIAESFATSTLWGFRVEAESEGRILLDATEFALRDAHGVVGALTRSRQGTWRLDPSRSVLHLPRTRAFPKNTEIEVALTFTGENPGAWVREVAPSADAITVHERHSFVELPEPGFTPRPFDPRAGFFDFSYFDYSAPFPQPLVRRFAPRHRLEKKDPSAAVSDPVKPIVYYLDPGVPEPIRTALLDGARWWNQAFEAAGYRNAFRVEVLPDSADPLDIRYNVINWVHRATRGWSYGSTVTDPRTGEILKGHVTLGSLRIRQDYLLAEGLLLPYRQGIERVPEAEAMALARIRQLSAHEVGHTLGLGHNYIASAQGRASVMDYPHPVAKLRSDGTVDLSDAYPEGIGAWDKVSVAWGYQDFPAGTDEAAALERVLATGRTAGLTYLTDQDARPTGSAHPATHLWDNGTDAGAELLRMLQLRRAVLDRFGEAAIRRGMPLATIEETLVPLYLHHRYQVEAAVKAIGGQTYSYAIRGDGQVPVQAVPAAAQLSALDAVLRTLDPAALALPRALLKVLPPRPAGIDRSRELFDRETGLVFDAVSPAAGAADMVLSLLFDSERAARLVQQHALDPEQPSFDAVIDRTLAAVFAPAADPYQAELGRAVQRVAVERLMGLAADAGMSQVRAMAAFKLGELQERLGGASADVPARAHRALLAADIGRFLDRDYDPAGRPRPAANPPGSPIGELPPQDH
jgi:hypothetical protein